MTDHFIRHIKKITPLYMLLKWAVRQFWKLKEPLINYGYPAKEDPSLGLQEIRGYNKSRELGPSRLICNAPFTNLHFNVFGEVLPCCANRQTILGNISNDSLTDIWSGQVSNNLRRRIENYNLTGGCAGCMHAIQNKNYSAAYASNYDYPVLFREPARSGMPDQMTFEVSNVCNLECIMCYGEYSNLIRKNRDEKDGLPMLYKDEFTEQLIPFLQHLRRASFLGGEPMLIKQYYRIWDEITKANKDCTIHVQTNATLLPEKFTAYLAGSLNFSIGISIDSLRKERYEEIRKNADFEEVMKNIGIYARLARQGVLELSFSFCLMSINYDELGDFLRFCREHNAKPDVIFLNDPEYLSLASASLSVLNSVETHLSMLSKERDLPWPRLIDGNLENVRAIIKARSTKDNRIPADLPDQNVLTLLIEFIDRNQFEDAGLLKARLKEDFENDEVYKDAGYTEYLALKVQEDLKGINDVNNAGFIFSYLNERKRNWEIMATQ